jgi:hypothetical protein
MSEDVARKLSNADSIPNGTLVTGDKVISSDRWVKVIAPKKKFHLHYAKIKSKYEYGNYYGTILVEDTDSDTAVTVTRMKLGQLASSSQFMFASDEEVRQIENCLGELSVQLK